MGKDMGGRAGQCLTLPAYSSFSRREKISHDHSLILEKVVGLEDDEEKEGQKKVSGCSAQSPAVWELGPWTSGAVCPRELSSEPPPLCQWGFGTRVLLVSSHWALAPSPSLQSDPGLILSQVTHLSVLRASE